MQKIKSFEVAQNEKVGDVLSSEKKGKNTKLRIGVLCGGWFEWWLMFADTDLEKQVKKDAEDFVASMRKRFEPEYEIIYPGMIDTLDNSWEAGESLKKSMVDVVVITETTYLIDYMALESLSHLPDVPIIMVATQATKALPPKMNHVDLVRYEGLVGMTQLVGAFKKMGKKYKVVAGAIDEPLLYEKLKTHFTVLQTAKFLKYADLGMIGHTFRGMYDLEIDKTKLKGSIGPSVIYIDAKHFTDIWKDVSDKDVAAYKADLDKRIPVPYEEVTNEDITKSIRVGLAMDRLAKRFGLDGISVLGQHHLEIATRASTDFAHYVIEREGCMHTCEGDLANLSVKIMMHRLSGKVPLFLEWTAFDGPSNTLLLTHHGVVDAETLCADMKQCRWSPAPEKWDFEGNGLSVEFCGKAGPVTLAGLIDDKDGWKMLISTGECVQMKSHPCRAPQFYFKPNMDVRRYIEEIMQEGVTHHVICSYGNLQKEIELLTEYLGINKMVI